MRSSPIWFGDLGTEFRQEVLAMLVITRREGEEVIIGNPASPIGIVRVASIKGDRVRLAFEFPREVDVHRREVAEQILAAEANAPHIIASIRPASEAT
jgi:carbon storage regulator